MKHPQESTETGQLVLERDLYNAIVNHLEDYAAVLRLWYGPGAPASELDETLVKLKNLPDCKT